MGDAENSILPASSIDRRLISAAARYASAEEMSEAVMGKLTPAQCLERVNYLLDAKTPSDEIRERRLLLISMAEHLDWLKTKRDDPGSWSSLARMYKVLSDQIERTNINVSDMSTKLASDHARFFMDAIAIGFDKVIKAITERDEIVIPDEEVIELLEIGASASGEYLEKVTSKGADE